jgi:hypothetical protein
MCIEALIGDCIEALREDIEQIISVARDNGDPASNTTEQIIGKVKSYIGKGWL